MIQMAIEKILYVPQDRHVPIHNGKEYPPRYKTCSDNKIWDAYVRPEVDIEG